MQLQPSYSETVVLAYSPSELMNRLAGAVVLVDEPRVERKLKADEEILFNGRLEQDRFYISKRIRHPENFLPLIKGRVEETSTGSILLLEYSLFFSTKLFLGFWSFFCLLTGFVLYAVGNETVWGLGLILFAAIQYVLCMFFFYRQVIQSRDLLYTVLDVHKVPWN